MAERILIWGAGGHGRVVAELAHALGYDVLGFVDADAGQFGAAIGGTGLRVVVTEEELLDVRRGAASAPWQDAAIALGIGDNATRLNAYSRADATMPTLVHPAAVVSPSAVLGPGSVVFPGAVVNADAYIGTAVIVNSGAIVEHDCRIGDGAHISPGAVLTGRVIVGRLAWIGAGATVLPGISIGDCSIIGAGSVAARDVPEDTVAVGIPARAVRPRESKL